MSDGLLLLLTLLPVLQNKLPAYEISYTCNYIFYCISLQCI